MCDYSFTVCLMKVESWCYNR